MCFCSLNNPWGTSTWSTDPSKITWTLWKNWTSPRYPLTLLLWRTWRSVGRFSTFIRFATMREYGPPLQIGWVNLFLICAYLNSYWTAQSAMCIILDMNTVQYRPDSIICGIQRPSLGLLPGLCPLFSESIFVLTWPCCYSDLLQIILVFLCEYHSFKSAATVAMLFLYPVTGSRFLCGKGNFSFQTIVTLMSC